MIPNMSHIVTFTMKTTRTTDEFGQIITLGDRYKAAVGIEVCRSPRFGYRCKLGEIVTFVNLLPNAGH